MPSRSVDRPRAGAAWRLAAVLVGAVLLAVASVAGVNAWNAGVGLNVRFATIPDALPDGQEPNDAARPPLAPGSGGPSAASAQNILVLGIDASRPGREGALARDTPPRRPAAETVSGIALVNVPASRTRVGVLTILPETTVQLPEQASVTLTQALSAGGVSSLVEAVQGLVGARIDHVAAIDVGAIGVMTDAVGGVELGTSSETGPNAGTPGEGSRLTGPEVLDVLRMPAGTDAGGAPIADGLLEEGVQQDVVRGLLEAVDRKGTFRSLRETGELAEDLAPFIAVDEGLTVGYLSSLRLNLRDMTSDVAFGTLPVVPDAQGSASAAPEAAALAAVREAIGSDSLAEHLDRVTPRD